MNDNQVQYKTEERDGKTVFEVLDNRVDTRSAPFFKTEMLKLVAGGSKFVLLNCKNIESVDSSGLGALTFSKRQIEDIGGEMIICCLQDRVKTLFNIAKLDTVFKIFDSVEEALESFDPED